MEVGMLSVGDLKVSAQSHARRRKREQELRKEREERRMEGEGKRREECRTNFFSSSGLANERLGTRLPIILAGVIS
jgi:hypothetical protein